MTDNLLQQLQSSIDLIAQRKKLEAQGLQIIEQNKLLEHQRQKILSLHAQIDFLEIKLLRLSSPARRVG